MKARASLPDVGDKDKRVKEVKIYRAVLTRRKPKT